MAGQALAGENEGPGPEDDFEPGFSGYVQPMVGIMSTKSNSEVGDENEKINSLNQDAESETQFAPMLLLNTKYTLDNRATQFYIGTAGEEVIEGAPFLEAGIRQKLSDDTLLSAAFASSFCLMGDEVWSDPFLTGQKRKKN